jgi:hypothetical protein
MKSRVIQDEPDRPDRSPSAGRAAEPDAPEPDAPPPAPPTRARRPPARWKLRTQPTRAVVLSLLIIAIVISVLWIGHVLR